MLNTEYRTPNIECRNIFSIPHTHPELHSQQYDFFSVHEVYFSADAFFPGQFF